MSTEIEHKYLVINNSYKEMSTSSCEIVQGYIDRTPQHVVRLRRYGQRCLLTIKGKNSGDKRLEFEYEIPESDFPNLLSLCSGRIIRKRRWLVPYQGFVWEVDEFQGDLNGLTVAEIELPDSSSHYPFPPFVGQNVTNDPRYYNSNL